MVSGQTQGSVAAAEINGTKPAGRHRPAAGGSKIKGR